jgi:hypothetical protein
MPRAGAAGDAGGSAAGKARSTEAYKTTRGSNLSAEFRISVGLAIPESWEHATSHRIPQFYVRPGVFSADPPVVQRLL